MTEGGGFTSEQVAFLMSGEFSALRGEFHNIVEKYGDSFRIQTQLRKRFPALDPALLAAGSTVCELQRKARGKSGLPDDALFTRQSQEQSSSAATARLHASLLHGHGALLEWCGGAGSDTLALSREASRVTVLEPDPVVAAFLRHNMAAAGRENVTVLEDTAERHLAEHGLEGFEALFADPSRRSEGRRTVDGEQYSPPLSFCQSAAMKLPTVVKTAPASDFDAQFWRRMFVAVGRECREQLLLRGVEAPRVCAVDAETLERWVPTEAGAEAPARPRYLIEPHAAVIRTGEVRAYLAEHNAVPIDPQIAYGVAAALPAPSRWHSSFEILDTLPFQRSRVQEALRAHDFGSETEIKKRGFRLLPEEVRAMFRFDGTTAGVLVCTRIGDEHVVYLCRRCGT